MAKELRIYVIDLVEFENSRQSIQEDLGFDKPNYYLTIDQNTDDYTFIAVAEMLGSVFSLGYFTQQVSNAELDNLTNSYVRAYIIETDNENIEPLLIDGDVSPKNISNVVI